MSVAKKSFSVDNLTVEIYGNEAELAANAAEFTHKYIQNRLQQQPEVRVIFATGNSQIQFLEIFTQLPEIDWSRVICFHLDEYLGIAANHPASFRSYLQARVEKRVKPQSFHYLQSDTLEPIRECDRYSQLLREQPIDLCFLGVGNNGHLAFNDPLVADFHDPYSVKLVKLDEINRQQQQGYFPHISTVPEYAFTLTLPMICAARKILCFAPGKHKATIVKRILQGEIHPHLPATILRTQPQATLYLDTDSAQLLEK
ncbi:glucosamine-6-phosphate deaminase [Calothrix sp. 336/3]|uniref:glucosamine-6-phosphate deaminase n=1 Tax=Calothrix sp. 336/3 TaxID=1337936 RepID=UPI0004E4487D|nr:glucosamine-6-phosphate deaminase [Calothrix sp. 336/3]AKG21736.1 glucosamine-6-phosphate deaminase [Calothrix sp. 336/3]